MTLKEIAPEINDNQSKLHYRELCKALPEKRQEDVLDGVPRYQNGVDQWGVEYATQVNDSVRVHNQTIDQCQANLAKFCGVAV